MNSTSRLIETEIIWSIETTTIVIDQEGSRVINIRETRTMDLLSRKSLTLKEKTPITLTIVTTERIYRGRRRSLKARLWTKILRHLIK